MKIMLYAKDRTEAGDLLERMGRSEVSGEVLEVYRTFDLFAERLRHPVDERNIVLLLVPDRHELERIATLQLLLSNVRVILIAPSQDPETVATAHRLRPRFLTYVDSDYSDISAVLKRMLDQEAPGNAAFQKDSVPHRFQ